MFAGQLNEYDRCTLGVRKTRSGGDSVLARKYTSRFSQISRQEVSVYVGPIKQDWRVTHIVKVNNYKINITYLSIVFFSVLYCPVSTLLWSSPKSKEFHTILNFSKVTAGQRATAVTAVVVK